MEFDWSTRPPRPPRHGLREYRLFFLHPVDDRILRSFDFQAPNDAQAMRIAEAWREGRAMELWSGARKLRAWAAES